MCTTTPSLIDLDLEAALRAVRPKPDLDQIEHVRRRLFGDVAPRPDADESPRRSTQEGPSEQ